MLEDLPLKTRKLILFISVFIISTAVIFFKFTFFSQPAEKVKDDELGSSFKQFGEEVGEILYQSKKQFGEIKNGVGELVDESVGELTPTDSTSTPAETATNAAAADAAGTADIDIEKLREELNQRLEQRQPTPISTSTNYAD